MRRLGVVNTNRRAEKTNMKAKKILRAGSRKSGVAPYWPYSGLRPRPAATRALAFVQQTQHRAWV